MTLDPRNHNWEKELERGLPDSRVRPIERERFRFQVGRLTLDRVFCANCHEPFGGVPPSCPHVFYICQKCVENNGAPPECIQATEV